MGYDGGGVVVVNDAQLGEVEGGLQPLEESDAVEAGEELPSQPPPQEVGMVYGDDASLQTKDISITQFSQS